MATVAAAMIVRNEELVLPRCLEVVRGHVDQIVVADTGSSDRTVEIAKELGAQVVYFPWIDDFSAARQFAFDHATTDWVFWLDADDLVHGADRIRAVVNAAPANVGVFEWRYFVGRNQDGSPSLIYWRERCARTGKGFHWAGRIHEVLLNESGLESLRTDEIYVQHVPPEGRVKDPNRNLRILEREFIEAGGHPGTRTLFYLGREYADTGNTDKAIEILTRSGREDPWNDQRYLALIQAAGLLVKRGDYERAADLFLESLKTHPTWPDAYFGLGEIAYYRKEWTHALHWLEIGKSLPEPNTPLFINKWKLQVEWLIYYTNALFNLGRLDDALEWTRRGLALDPTNQWHQSNLAFFQTSRRGREEAPALDEDLVCLGPDGRAVPC